MSTSAVGPLRGRRRRCASRFPHPASRRSRFRHTPASTPPLSLEQLRVGMRREGRDPEPLSLARQHLERREADRSGGSEDRDPTSCETEQPEQPRRDRRTKYTASSDRAPAVPRDEGRGILDADSPLEHDSATSPTCAATASTTPTVISCPDGQCMRRESSTRDRTRGP